VCQALKFLTSAGLTVEPIEKNMIES